MVRAAATASGLVGGFSIEPTTAKPLRRSNASLAASSLSAATISATNSSRVVVGSMENPPTNPEAVKAAQR